MKGGNGSWLCVGWVTDAEILNDRMVFGSGEHRGGCVLSIFKCRYALRLQHLRVIDLCIDLGRCELQHSAVDWLPGRFTTPSDNAGMDI